MRFLLVTAILAVSGCAAQQQQIAADATANHESIREQCNALYETAREKVECQADSRDRIYAANGFDGDLVAMLRATRISIAERVDAGTITDADGNVEYSLAQSRAVTEQQNRNLQRQTIASQRSAAIGNILRSTQQPAPRAPTNCTSRVVLGTLQTTCN